MNEEPLARYIEENERKHWDKYRAFVTDRNDPDQFGRLKLKVPSICETPSPAGPGPPHPTREPTSAFFPSGK